jgi:hypothetical protein
MVLPVVRSEKFLGNRVLTSSEIASARVLVDTIGDHLKELLYTVRARRRFQGCT